MSHFRKVRTARIVGLGARLPGVSALAAIVARTAAGSHHVGAMAVVVRTSNGAPDVMLARHTFHGGRWGLPGGWVRRREDPAAACEREVLEETGVRVRAAEVVGCELHAVDGAAIRYSGLTIAFRCAPVEPDQDQPAVRSMELTEVRWWSASSAGDLVTPFEQQMIARASDRVSGRPPTV
jgi:8-oxo-dGTP pyrophosphatase MutT (NUDIX family)